MRYIDSQFIIIRYPSDGVRRLNGPPPVDNDYDDADDDGDVTHLHNVQRVMPGGKRSIDIC